MDLMDKATIAFIPHHSIWVWFNLRVQYTCQLIAAAGILSCLYLKGTVSDSTLSLLLTYTLNLNWLHYIIGSFNWLERNLLDCEKLFNLTKIDQEKIKGEV